VCHGGEGRATAPRQGVPISRGIAEVTDGCSPRWNRGLNAWGELRSSKEKGGEGTGAAQCKCWPGMTACTGEENLLRHDLSEEKKSRGNHQGKQGRSCVSEPGIVRKLPLKRPTVGQVTGSKEVGKRKSATSRGQNACASAQKRKGKTRLKFRGKG